MTISGLVNFLRRLSPAWVLSIYHWALAVLAAAWYRNPSRRIIVIGVTGTNGKSSVVSFIGQLLESAGHRVGWTSTATFKIAEKEWLNNKKMTMLGRFALQSLLLQMVKSRCDFAVIETSSQGLVQNRHLGINYDTVVLTNLTPEHLEAHGGFEAYKQAKFELFSHLTRRPRKFLNGQIIPKTIIVNGADKHAEEFLKAPADKKIIFRLEDNMNVSANGSSFGALGVIFKTTLPGRYNAENILAAVTVAREFGLTDDELVQGAAKLQPVPGRWEWIDEGQPFGVLVDYAPEPASLEKLFEAVAALRRPRVIHVLGSAGGGRDRARRPVLGRLSADHASICIVTNEDPYDEDPLKIMEEVAAGARTAGKRDNHDLFVIPDRRQAIRTALRLAKPEDLVLITGKGCEQGMMIAGGRMTPWDDRYVAHQELRGFQNV